MNLLNAEKEGRTTIVLEIGDDYKWILEGKHCLTFQYGSWYRQVVRFTPWVFVGHLSSSALVPTLLKYLATSFPKLCLSRLDILGGIGRVSTVPSKNFEFSLLRKACLWYNHLQLPLNSSLPQCFRILCHAIWTANHAAFKSTVLLAWN